LGDVLDGLAARARDEITTWGKVLDPAADKALYVGLLCALYAMREIPTLAFVLFLIPQAALGVGAVVLRFGKRAVQAARVIGKIAAFVSFLAVGFLIMRWPGALEMLYAAIALAYIAALDYLRGAIRLRSNIS
jgi:CDP-diacylglycerol--glycerol-3-phosphate 3-phosphatidyltransferase